MITNCQLKNVYRYTEFCLELFMQLEEIPLHKVLIVSKQIKLSFNPQHILQLHNTVNNFAG